MIKGPADTCPSSFAVGSFCACVVFLCLRVCFCATPFELRRQLRLVCSARLAGDIPMSAASCHICIHSITEPCRLKACGHMFCYSCIHQWIGTNRIPLCPVCRAAIEGRCLILADGSEQVNRAARSCHANGTWPLHHHSLLLHIDMCCRKLSPLPRRMQKVTCVLQHHSIHLIIGIRMAACFSSLLEAGQNPASGSLLHCTMQMPT